MTHTLQIVTMRKQTHRKLQPVTTIYAAVERTSANARQARLKLHRPHHHQRRQRTSITVKVRVYKPRVAKQSNQNFENAKIAQKTMRKTIAVIQ